MEIDRAVDTEGNLAKLLEERSRIHGIEMPPRWHVRLYFWDRPGHAWLIFPTHALALRAFEFAKYLLSV